MCYTNSSPWGLRNLPSHFANFGVLEGTTPIVFSHWADLLSAEIQLARLQGHYISVTPESEKQFGQEGKSAYFAGDISALGADTHFIFSGGLLPQARLWLQQVRGFFHDQILDRWQVPSHTASSAYQAFLLATRAGGLALRRPDLGVIRVGAKADIVVWDAKNSLSMLGWVDPVAAIIMYANAGEVLHVLVDGQWKKRDGKVLAKDLDKKRAGFLRSARKIQKHYRETPYPVLEGEWTSGISFALQIYDTQAGAGNGLGQQFLD